MEIIPPAQPHRKAKLRLRQPLSPSLLQPGYPCGPKPPSSGSPWKGSQRSCTPAAKQKEACYADSAKQRTNRKKGCNRLPSSYSAQPARARAASSLAGRPSGCWGPRPLLDLSFPRSLEEQARKDGSRRPSSPPDCASPSSPSGPSREPLRRLLSPAAPDQARAVPGWPGMLLGASLSQLRSRMEGVLPPYSEPHGQFLGWTPSVQHTGKSECSVLDAPPGGGTLFHPRGPRGLPPATPLVKGVGPRSPRTPALHAGALAPPLCPAPALAACSPPGAG